MKTALHRTATAQHRDHPAPQPLDSATAPRASPLARALGRDRTADAAERERGASRSL